MSYVNVGEKLYDFRLHKIFFDKIAKFKNPIFKKTDFTSS